MDQHNIGASTNSDEVKSFDPVTRNVATSFLLSGIAVLVSTQLLQKISPAQINTAFLVIGGLLFVLGVIITKRAAIPSRLDRGLTFIARWLETMPWQPVILATGLLLTIFVPISSGESQLLASPIAPYLWIITIALVILGSWNQPLTKWNVHWKSLIVPAVLFVFALTVRSYATDRFPIFLTGDEGSAGNFALQYINGKVNNPFVSGWFSFPSLYFLIPAISIKLLGPTIPALRLPSALAGALTVIATYYVSRKMFNERVALFAAIFLSVFSYHIFFSRIGLNNIWDGLWFTLCVGLFWIGWEKNNRASYLLAGWCLGISQYFYSSSRVLVAMLLIWILIGVAMQPRKVKTVLPNLLLMFLVALVVYAPLGWYHLKHMDEFMAPLVRVSLLGPRLENSVQTSNQPAWQIIGRQIVEGFKAYINSPLQNLYTPETPLLANSAAALFVLGLVIFLIKKPDNRLILIVLWLSAFGFVGGLSENTPSAQRYVAAAPICAIIVGLGLHEVIDLFEMLWPKYRKIFMAAGLITLSLISLNELNFFFKTYTQISLKNNSHTPTMVADELSQFLEEKSSTTTIAFFGFPVMGYYSIPSLQYLQPEFKGLDFNQPFRSSDNPTLPTGEVIFVFLPHRAEELSSVQEAYPDGKTLTIPAYDNETLIWVYETQVSESGEN